MLASELCAFVTYEFLFFHTGPPKRGTCMSKHYLQFSQSSFVHLSRMQASRPLFPFISGVVTGNNHTHLYVYTIIPPKTHPSWKGKDERMAR